MQTETDRDEAEVRAAIDRYVKAISTKNADAVVACYTRDVIGFELAPPLEAKSSYLLDPANERKWFATWEGPIQSLADDVRVRVRGDLAVAHCLRYLKGTRVTGEKVESWFRATAAFERQGGEWKIFHIHNSVPTAMDGSGRALTDLKPE